MQLWNDEIVINEDTGFQLLFGEPVVLSDKKDDSKIQLEQLNEDIKENNSVVREKGWYMVGPFGMWGITNKNNRRYGEKVTEEAIKDVQSEIPYGLIGELEHPNKAKIDTERGCIMIKKLEKRPNGVIWGEARIMDTAYGQHLKTLIKEGYVPGVSTRAVGKLVKAKDGVYEVAEGLKFITVDVVQNPSAGTRPPVVINEEEIVIKENTSNKITIRNLLDNIFYGD